MNSLSQLDRSSRRQSSEELDALRERVRALEVQALFWENQCRANLRIIEAFRAGRRQVARRIVA